MVPITKQQGTPYESLEIADEKGRLLVGDVLFISGPSPENLALIL